MVGSKVPREALVTFAVPELIVRNGAEPSRGAAWSLHHDRAASEAVPVTAVGAVMLARFAGAAIATVGAWGSLSRPTTRVSESVVGLPAGSLTVAVTVNEPVAFSS